MSKKTTKNAKKETKLVCTENKALFNKTYRDKGITTLINNKSLAKYVEWFASAEKTVKGNQWKAIRYMGKMATVDMIKDDFGSDAKFAEFMGMSQSSVNKMKRLAKIADRCEKLGMSVSNAYELLPLGAKLEEFLNMEADSGSMADIVSLLSQKDLRGFVKEYLDSFKDDKKIEDKSDESSGEGSPYENIGSNEDEEEGFCEFVIPVYAPFGNSRKGEKMVQDARVNLSDSQSERIAKAITKLLEEMGVEFTIE